MTRFLKLLSLRTKIVGTTALILVVFLVTSGYALYSMSNIGEELVLVSEKDLPLSVVVSEVTRHQLEQHIALEAAMRFAHSLGPRSDRVGEAIQRFSDLSDQISQQLSRAHQIASSVQDMGVPRLVEEFQQIDNALTQYEVDHRHLEQRVGQGFSGLQNGDLQAAEKALSGVEAQIKELDKSLLTLTADIMEFTQASATSATLHEASALRVVAFLVVVSAIVGLLVSWLVAGTIADGVRKAVVTASGDLTQEIRVDSKDEIGELLHAMNGMRKKLLAMISQISSITAQLAAASEEMSVITDQTARTIDDQRSETDQLATAMNEMAATAQEIAHSISNTANAVTEASAHADDGRTTVERSISEISRLASDIESSAQAIRNLEQTSTTIGSVLQVIQAIAEQTNLLALNAAIEAARAGDHGRGFAVVADEVRALASRTHTSTQEIEQMISELQTVSHQAVTSMEHNRKQAGKTVDFATEAGTKLGTITGVMVAINDMATQIASASEQQVGVANDITANIVRLNTMSEQTAESAEETATAGQDLTRMANELQEIVVQFQV